MSETIRHTIDKFRLEVWDNQRVRQELRDHGMDDRTAVGIKMANGDVEYVGYPLKDRS